MPFGKEKLEWLGYGEKNLRYVYSFCHNPRTWRTDRQTDKHTDRHRMTAQNALMHSIAWQ